jgi:6-pyruvoyl-tetrahydropterin synthase
VSAPRFSITVSSAFTAGHWHDKTLGEPPHSHDFEYEITFCGPLNPEGYLIDFREAEAALKRINAAFEGRMLNDIMPCPTAENLALRLLEEARKIFPQAAKIKLKEKDNYYACCEF